MSIVDDAKELGKKILVASVWTAASWYAKVRDAVLDVRLGGIWGEPERPDPIVETVPPRDPIIASREDLYRRAAADFERWQKMTPRERDAALAARDAEWAATASEGKREDS